MKNLIQNIMARLGYVPIEDLYEMKQDLDKANKKLRTVVLEPNSAKALSIRMWIINDNDFMNAMMYGEASTGLSNSKSLGVLKDLDKPVGPQDVS